MRVLFRLNVRYVLVSFVLTLLFAPLAQAQYFGRNKVQWESFEFKTLKTEHFDIYYYDEEADVVHDVARMSERWYARLSRVFNHSFPRKPIVLYANAADFHQTTTTGGTLGEGTGGFTDAFMNRVVLPLTGDYAQNDHVLGHEMVHVFQYDIAASSNQQRRRFALEALPLWLIEGMAEYFSKGRVDPLTAMWIRDATIHDRMPDITSLTRDPRYFPYRYGQALMAYIGARFGDEAVVRYFMAAGVVGPEEAVERSLGITPKQLFADWAESSRELYSPIVQARTAELAGPLIGTKPQPPPAEPAATDKEQQRRRRRRGTTELNVGPTISPDGRYVAFLSARELFSIDLFLADAKTGKVIRKLISSDRDQHFESLRFIESAGAWSPDSRQIAFITFAKGDNYLSFVDVETREARHLKVQGLEAIATVAWSPDGRTIAMAGQASGVSDLFLYDIETKEVRRLTADKYADLHPAWSPDGRSLVFVTDRGRDTVLEQLRMTKMRLATIEVSSGNIREIEGFPGATHINPQYAPDGQSIYFIGNPEGIPDIYRVTVPGGELFKVTNVDSGVAGITDMAPAMSVAGRTGEIAFSVYEDDNYNIYTLPAGTAGTATTAGTAPAENAAARGALLPPLRGTGSEITAYLMRPEEGLPPASAQFTEKNYNPDLRLAYLGPPTLGIGMNEFGFGAGGSVTAYFSDILGQHNVGFTLQGGGGSGTSNLSEQLGGELFYLNQKHRFNWGANLVHIPYVYGAAGYSNFAPPGVEPVPGAEYYIQEKQVQLISDGSFIGAYPLSSTRRVEGAVGMQRYSQKIEQEIWTVVGGNVQDRTVIRLPGSYAITFAKASAAFVGDASVFGFISPINGTRYRYEAEALNGDLRFQTLLADYRRYQFFRPYTAAFRFLHYGRYGDGAEDPRLSPLYLGNGPVMRGYDPYSIDAQECGTDNPALSCPVFDRLIGTRIGFASLEFRAPLFGTREFGLINAPFIPTEIYGFADAGAAWSDNQEVNWVYETRSSERIPVFSVGVGVRMLLSYIPLEFYAAKPFQRPDEGFVYGFLIASGW